MQQREQALKGVLQQYIQNKTMYLAFDRDLRKNDKDKYKPSTSANESKDPLPVTGPSYVIGADDVLHI